jgi:hypothetical protein
MRPSTHVQRLLSLLLTALFLLSACQPQPSAPATAASAPAAETPSGPTGAATPITATLQSLTYTPLPGDVVNPERGFRYSFDDFAPSDFGVYRNLGTSLVYSDIDLRDFRDRDISQEKLDQIQAAFDAVRQGGMKVILRVKYNDGPWPNSEPDASLEQILRHIEQLKPLFQKNADVIAWVHAGFIGAWGEWHTSTHGLDKDPAAKQAVINALAQALPPDRFIQLRYPFDLMSLFPQPLSAEQAFSGTLQARLGFHNDCFLSSDTDVGTYDRGGVNERPQATAYLSQVTQFAPAGGETCQVYEPLQSCEAAIREMETLHWTDLNISYHKQVIKNWQKAGCFEEIQKRLGYRLVLQEAGFPSAAQIGTSLTLTVKLRNEGFASPLNPRPFYAVLDGPATFTLPLEGIDPRGWLPGEHVISTSLALPADAPEGEYRLALWLPDPAESLKNDPRYAIRFANEGVWEEAKGWNVLGTMTLTRAAVQTSEAAPQPPASAAQPTATVASIPPTAAATATPGSAASPMRPAANGLDMVAIPLSTPPTLDGDLSDWPSFPCYTLDKPEQIGYGDPASWGGPDDLSGSFCWGWDESALYLAFEVRDDVLRGLKGANIWENDYLEVWLDVNLAGDFDETKNNGDDFQFGFMPGDFGEVAPKGTVFVPPISSARIKSIESAFARTANGYRGEVKIPFTVFGDALDLSQGVLGATVAFSDNDSAQPAQEMMISTAPGSISQWGNPTLWNNLKLGK